MCLYIVLLLVAAFSTTWSQLLVTLPNGQIHGHQLQSFTNKTYYGYQSIPYATPPLGALRFQAPQPAQNWSGVLNATKESNMCYQLESDNPAENEDCLYINVYTPVLDRVKDRTKLPVIFWIYGGGLRNGAALFQSYRPDYWMDEDVIMVTHNYRVGIFGFLSTGDSIIPGNNGLKDQVLALQWTYDNIHLFGGDKDKITIHGQSAGGVSASYHLLIKQSAGLFRSVIAESGSPLDMYSFSPNPKEYALQLAQGINPNISRNATSEEIRDYLLRLDGRTIDSFSAVPKIPQPAISLEPESPTAVVTKEMYEMFDCGDFYKVPVLMGMESEEALFIATSDSYLRELGATYDKDPSYIVPAIFPHNESTDMQEVSDAIKLIYLNETEKWTDHPGRVVRHFSDNKYTRGIIKQGKLMSQYIPVYFYLFSYDGDVGGGTIVVEDAEKVQHSEEMRYVYLNRSLSDISKSDALTHKRMIRLWSNFIKYENPTPKSDALLQYIAWPQVCPTNYQYLNINDTLSIQTNPKEDFFPKWEHIFDTYAERPFATY